MNKKIFILIFVFMILFSSYASAWFTLDHTIFTLEAFNEVNSPITQMCKNKLDIVLDGNFAADIPVLHYIDSLQNKVPTSYSFTHSVGSGYNECMELAGSDINKKCFCYGVGLHEVQDPFSHGTEGVQGLTATYLKKGVTTNLIGHMIVEKDFQNKHLPLVKELYGDTFVSTAEYYGGENKNAIICNNLCDSTGCKTQYMSILNEMANQNMELDADTICKGYKGFGFYDTVYVNKVGLPGWAYTISLGMFILCAILAGLALWKGNSNSYKWAFIGIMILFAIIGLILYISVVTGTSWKLVNVGLQLPPKIGWLSVSETDMKEYHQLVIDSSNQFLRTGIVPYDDVTGLEYCDSDGNCVIGQLAEAEKTSRIVFLLIEILFAIFILFLFYKTFISNK